MRLLTSAIVAGYVAMVAAAFWVERAYPIDPATRAQAMAIAKLRAKAGF